MDFKPHEGLAHQVADYIADRIIRMQLKPGERVLEARLAAEMAISRGPIREALRILENRRLVEILPRRGARVTEFSEAYVDWLYDILRELFALVAYRGVENGTDEDLERIKESYARMERCADKGDVPGYYDAVFEYGLRSLAAVKNPVLEQTLTDLWPSVRRIHYASLSLRSQDLRKSLVHFKRCIEYYENGDPAGAARTIREMTEVERAHAKEMFAKGLVGTPLADQGEQAP